MNDCTIDLTNGKYITVDAEDVEWIEKESWRWIALKNQSDKETIYIESMSERFRYLHHLFFPKKQMNARIEFANGDPFDYRKSNIFKVSYYTRKRYRSRHEQIVRTVKMSSLGIIKNRCVIAPTNLCHRSLLCATCSTVSDSHYEECLEIAAAGNWSGWDVVEKGKWCSAIQARLLDLIAERKRQYE